MQKAKKILLALTILAALSACQTPPTIRVKTWAGDSANEAIARKQDSLEIKCSDSKFDNYLCVTYDDFKAIRSLILRCRKWDYSGSARMDDDEAWALWVELDQKLSK